MSPHRHPDWVRDPAKPLAHSRATHYDSDVRYRFDDFELAVGPHELRHGGDLVAIEPQVFSLLVYLVENHARVVSKDELIEAIWGGRVVSEAAVSSRIKSARQALNDSGREQRYIKTIHGRGVRFVGDVATTDDGGSADKVAVQKMVAQDIRFCLSADGAKIAYATAGEGPPLIKTANWLNHLEFDWQSPVWTHIFSDLMQGRQLIRYDARGNGLSDWKVTDFSFERQVEDLEAIVDAAGIDRFPLIGMSQGCPVSVAYAAKYPERVSKLILFGGYVRGWRFRGAETVASSEAMGTLIRTGWGRNDPTFRQMFTSLFMPDAPPENQNWFNELQLRTTSPDNAANLLEALGHVDVTDILSKVEAPTLVIHCRGDMRVPMSSGQELAAAIPGARFMSVESDNHIVPATDPAWAKISDAINLFLAE